MMQLIFVVIEYKISHFFGVIQFNKGESLITYFLGIHGQVFCLGTFFVNWASMVLCNEPQKIYSPGGCHEIAFLGIFSHNGLRMQWYGIWQSKVVLMHCTQGAIIRVLTYLRYANITVWYFFVFSHVPRRYAELLLSAYLFFAGSTWPFQIQGIQYRNLVGISCVWDVLAWNMIALMALRNVGVGCLK
jgi:hypothetical protein